MRGEGKEVFGYGLDTKRQKEGLRCGIEINLWNMKKTKEYLTYYIIQKTIYAAKPL